MIILHLGGITTICSLSPILDSIQTDQSWFIAIQWISRRDSHSIIKWTGTVTLRRLNVFSVLLIYLSYQSIRHYQIVKDHFIGFIQSGLKRNQKKSLLRFHNRKRLYSMSSHQPRAVAFPLLNKDNEYKLLSDRTLFFMVFLLPTYVCRKSQFSAHILIIVRLKNLSTGIFPG